MRRALLLLLFANACFVDVPVEDRACDDEHPCVSDFQCVFGVCREESELDACVTDSDCELDQQCADFGFCIPADLPGEDAGPTQDAGLDGGAADAGPTDAGPTDAGQVDAGPTDAGLADAGRDGGPADAGLDDAGVIEPDAGLGDAGLPRATTGLLAFYSFDEGEGGTVADLSGLPNATGLVVEGATSWVTGGLDFTASDGIATTESAALHVIDPVKSSGEITLEVWTTVRPNQNASSSRLVSFSESTQAFDRNATIHHTDTGATIRFKTSLTGGTVEELDTSNIMSDGLHHVVLTYNDGILTLYEDGAFAESFTLSGTLGTWVDRRLHFGNEQTLNRGYDGTIWLAAIYDRALTEAQVLRNYTRGAQPLPDADGDGRRDFEDNCPNVANAAQNLSACQ